MAYKTSVESASRIMSDFYENLLANGKGMRVSVKLARASLDPDAKSKARFDENIKCQAQFTCIYYEARKDDATCLNDLEKDLAALNRLLATTRSKEVSTAVTKPLASFDDDILSLEMILSVSNTVVLHGAPGTGKSTLVDYLRTWWTMTYYASEVQMIDLSTMRDQSEVIQLCEETEREAQEHKPSRHNSNFRVVISENFDFHDGIMNPAGVAVSTVPKLNDLFASPEEVSTNLRIIAVSRMPPGQLEFQKFVAPLHGKTLPTLDEVYEHFPILYQY